MRRSARLVRFCAFAALALGFGARADLPPDLDLTAISNDTFASPLAVREPNDGTGRLFVVERGGSCVMKQGTASIWIVKDGVKSASPFLTVPVACGNTEQGLLGLAFHPQYATNGLFFVTYTLSTPQNSQGACVSGCLGTFPDQVLARFHVSGNPDIADPNSKLEILHIPDLAGNHNGGDIHFGPDGYLYWSMGDGGVQGDTNGFALCEQKKAADNNPGTCGVTPGGALYYMLGKILRLDVDNSTAAATSDMCGASLGQPANYSIPNGNPRKGQAGYCGEIWAKGLRNPFRFSFDRATGDMFIGDVGYNTTEEVDYQPAATSIANAFNYGWRTCEGPYPQGQTSGTCNTGTLPIASYPHSGGIAPSSCSVIGGYLYRGPIPGLVGTYVFSDYCSGDLLYATGSGSNWTLARLVLPSNRPVQPQGFGQDELGNVYVADANGGKIYRFSSATEVVDAVFDDGFEDP